MTTQVRATPGGTMLADPLGMKVAIEDYLDLAVEEKNVTPSGINRGEPIDMTTHFNTKRHTKRPRKIYDRKPLVFTANYDPTVWAALLALLKLTTDKDITLTYPDGTTEDERGWVNRAEPTGYAATGGGPAEIEIEIVFSGLDSDGNEADVDFKAAAGSDI